MRHSRVTAVLSVCLTSPADNSDQVLHVAGEPGAMPGEGHALDHHPPAGLARQPPQPAAHEHPPGAEVQGAPRRGPGLPVVPRRRLPAAVRAHQMPATQPHVDEHDPLVVDELHPRDPRPDELEQLVEYSGHVHGL